MTEYTSLELEQLEFFRRLRLVELAKGTFYKVPLVVKQDQQDKGEVPLIVPADVEDLSCWSNVKHDGREMLLYVPPDVDVPIKLKSSRVALNCEKASKVSLGEVKSKDFNAGELDALIPPYTTGKLSDTLHSSYAHTVLLCSDTFTYSADPLRESNNTGEGNFVWTQIRDGFYVRANGTAVTNKDSYGNYRYPLYAGPLMIKADYSVEASVTCNRGTGTATSACPGVAGRIINSANNEVLYVYCAAGQNSIAYWVETISNTPTTIASWNTGGTAINFLLRMQMVGTSGVGYINGINRLTPTLSITAPGSAGIYFRLGNTSGPTYPSYLDNFHVYHMPPPTKPTNVQASDGTYTDKCRITWTASSGPGTITYSIKRDGQQIASGHPASPYDDLTGEPDRVYSYRVQAHSEYGDSEVSAPDDGFRSTIPPCPATWSVSNQTLTLNAASNSKGVALTSANEVFPPPTFNNVQSGRPVTRHVITHTCKAVSLHAHYSKTITAGSITLTPYFLTRASIQNQTLAAGDVVLVATEYTDVDPPNGTLEVAVRLDLA